MSLQIERYRFPNGSLWHEFKGLFYGYVKTPADENGHSIFAGLEVPPDMVSNDEYVEFRVQEASLALERHVKGAER